MRRDVFQAIADPNRRLIIDLLARKRMSMNEVSEQFDVSRPAISKHIRILEECGLIHVINEGRERYCEVRLENLSELDQWLSQHRAFWTSKLDALGDFLSEKTMNSKTPKKNSSSKSRKK